GSPQSHRGCIGAVWLSIRQRDNSQPQRLGFPVGATCDTNSRLGVAAMMPPQIMQSIAVSLLLGATVTAAPPAPVTAMAYRPDGKQLGVGVSGKVLLVDAATGAIVERAAVRGTVTGLAWNPKTSELLAASGAPGKVGEISVVAFGAARSDDTPDEFRPPH